MVAVTISPKGSHQEGLSPYLTCFQFSKGKTQMSQGPTQTRTGIRGPQSLPVPLARVQFPLHQGAANKALEAATPAPPHWNKTPTFRTPGALKARPGQVRAFRKPKEERIKRMLKNKRNNEIKKVSSRFCQAPRTFFLNMILFLSLLNSTFPKFIPHVKTASSPEKLF